jgi:Ca2+-binding EF-hand superfamily protein
MRKLNTFIVSSLLAFSMSTFAHEVAIDLGDRCISHSKVSFEEADKDKDGTLDREEAKLVCKEKFEVMDVDKDGTVSKEELDACGQTKHKSHSKKQKKSTN